VLKETSIDTVLLRPVTAGAGAGDLRGSVSAPAAGLAAPQPPGLHGMGPSPAQWIQGLDPPRPDFRRSVLNQGLVFALATEIWLLRR